MAKTIYRSVAEQLERVAPAIRPTVDAARRLVQAVAPNAVELAYQGQPPRSPSAWWKVARYTIEGTGVVGIATIGAQSLLFFYKGRALDDRTGLLEGGGKEMRFIRLHSPADLRRPEISRIVRKAFDLTRAGQREGFRPRSIGGTR